MDENAAGMDATYQLAPTALLLPSPFFSPCFLSFPLSPPILKLAIIVGVASVSAFRFLDLLPPRNLRNGMLQHAGP